MMTTTKHLIVIGGATAVGKSALALALAQQLGTVILSADSRQVYNEMTIGTAKPTPHELAAVPHYFINHCSIHDAFTAHHFEQQALALLNTLFQQHEYVVVVGGTGLYIDALCQGLDAVPPITPDAQQKVADLWAAQGLLGWQTTLRNADPAYAERADLANPRRLQRALEVYYSSGQPYSSFLRATAAERPFAIHRLVLALPRETLYTRINERVDTMLENGLVEEVQTLLPYQALKALQTVGYQELFNYLNGHWSLPYAIEKIKQHTRNYAKRQVTWFAHQGNWTPFAPTDLQAITAYLEKVTSING